MNVVKIISLAFLLVWPWANGLYFLFQEMEIITSASEDYPGDWLREWKKAARSVPSSLVISSSRHYKAHCLTKQLILLLSSADTGRHCFCLVLIVLLVSSLSCSDCLFHSVSFYFMIIHMITIHLGKITADAFILTVVFRLNMLAAFILSHNMYL